MVDAPGLDSRVMYTIDLLVYTLRSRFIFVNFAARNQGCSSLIFLLISAWPPEARGVGPAANRRPISQRGTASETPVCSRSQGTEALVREVDGVAIC